ncbi:MAG: SDR family NAD(P)-dependent oxidoreductase [Thermodesulfobacteriota bacterium]
MKSLKDNIILITGAAGGLGQEFARQLLALGAHLILTDLDEKALAEISGGLRQASGKILGMIGADISGAKGCEQLHQEVQRIAPRVDMLINNAGLINYGYFWEIPADKWEKLMEVNLTAPMRLCRLFVPDMIARGDGHVVFICSVAGFAATSLGTPYSTSKFGLRGFAMGLSGELKDKGVRATIVYPSWVNTKLLRSPEFGAAAVKPLPSIFAEDPVKVIREAITGIRKNRLHVCPGLFAKIVWQAARVRPIVSRQSH